MIRAEKIKPTGKESTRTEGKIRIINSIGENNFSEWGTEWETDCIQRKYVRRLERKRANQRKEKIVYV